MMKHSQYIFLSFLILALSSCVFHSSQVSSLLGVLESNAGSSTPNSWQVQYLNYETIVYPVAISNGTLFTNQYGEAIFFDGWTIRRVIDFGLESTDLSIVDNGSKRKFEKKSLEVTTHSCGHWRSEHKGGQFVYTQGCEGKIPYINSVTVGKDGFVSSISQIIDEGYIPISLIKLN